MALFAAGHNCLVLQNDDFWSLAGQVIHLSGALDAELVSFCDGPSGADVEAGSREGLYREEDKPVGLRFKPGSSYSSALPLPLLRLLINF